MNPFTTDQFVSGQHTAVEKAKFGNHFVRFLLKGCPLTLFHKWFYTRLSMTFGHIAHYNRGGFYAKWFETHEDRTNFIQHTLQHGCYGQPEYTCCDVERAIQSWYADNKDKVDAAFTKRRQSEEVEASSETDRLKAVEDQTSQDFRIVAKSQNTGAFGHYEYIVVAKDGSAYKIGIIPSNQNHYEGETITTPLKSGKPTWAGLFVEAPNRIKDAPKEVIEQAWAVQVTSV